MRCVRETIKLVLGILGAVILTSSLAMADSITLISGTPGSSNYENVSGTITAGAGTVTITLTNDLTNAQVFSIAQNISGVFFTVSGFTGSGASLASGSSFQSTSIANGSGTLLGALNPTGWVAGNSGTGLVVCVICPSSIQGKTAAPTLTIVGGNGLGAYSNANASINGTTHNPYLADTVTFTLNVPGVTASSTFTNVGIQFGTSAGTPTPVPEPRELALVLLTGGVIFGGIGISARRST